MSTDGSCVLLVRALKLLAESLQVSTLTSSVLVQNKLFVVCVQEPMEAVLCLSSCVMNTWRRCCCPTLEDLRGSALPTRTHFSRGRLFLIFLLDVLRTCSHSLCLRSCTASHFCIIVRELRCSRVFNSCELAPIPTSQEERWCCQSHTMSANGVKCMLFPTNIETVRSRVVHSVLDCVLVCDVVQWESWNLVLDVP